MTLEYSSVYFLFTLVLCLAFYFLGRREMEIESDVEKRILENEKDVLIKEIRDLRDYIEENRIWR